MGGRRRERRTPPGLLVDVSASNLPLPFPELRVWRAVRTYQCVPLRIAVLRVHHFACLISLAVHAEDLVAETSARVDADSGLMHASPSRRIRAGGSRRARVCARWQLGTPQIAESFSSNGGRSPAHAGNRDDSRDCRKPNSFVHHCESPFCYTEQCFAKLRKTRSATGTPQSHGSCPGRRP